MSWSPSNRVFREYVARSVPQALGLPQPGQIPLPTQAATPPWVGPQGAAAMGLPQASGPVASDAAQVAALLATLARLRQRTPPPIPAGAGPRPHPQPTPQQAAAVQAYLQQQTQGGQMPPGTVPIAGGMPPLPAMQNLGARRGVGFTGGEDAAGLHLPPEERARLAEMAVADYGRQAAERRTQEAGEAHADPVAGFIIEEALPRLDVPRQENIEHVIGPIIRQVVTGDVNDWAAGVAGGLPVVGPILGGLDFLQETLNDTQFAEGMRQAATQGYNGFTGDRAVWEYLIGQTDDWHPVPRFIVRALADTAVDPLTLLPLIGKIGAGLRGAAVAGKAARGATTASMGERAMDITGRILQAPTVLLDEPIDAIFGTAGAVLRGAGGKIGGLFDLTTNQRVRDIAEEEVAPTLADLRAAREQPAPTGQVTETDYFGPGGSMEPEPPVLALPAGAVPGSPERPLVTPPPDFPASTAATPPPPVTPPPVVAQEPIVSPPPAPVTGFAPDALIPDGLPTGRKVADPGGTGFMFDERRDITVGMLPTLSDDELQTLLREQRQSRATTEEGYYESGAYMEEGAGLDETDEFTLSRVEAIGAIESELARRRPIHRPRSGQPRAPITPPPAPAPVQPKPAPSGIAWLDRLRGMTREERSAQIKDPRSKISAWTPTEKGHRLIDRAYFKVGDQYPDRRAAFDAEVAESTQRFVATQRQHDKQTWYDTLQQKQAMGAINGVEYTVNTIAPAYRRHFGDVDPIERPPYTSKPIAEIAEDGNYVVDADGNAISGTSLIETAVYGSDAAKADSIVRYLDRTLPQGATDRIRAARAKAQEFRGVEAQPQPAAKPDVTIPYTPYEKGSWISGGIRFNSTSRSGRVGSFEETVNGHRIEGAINNGSDQVVPDQLSNYKRRKIWTVHTNGFGAILNNEYVTYNQAVKLANETPTGTYGVPSPRSATAADFALTPQSAAAQTQAALREAGQAIGGAAPDLVGAPEQGVIPRALGEGITAGQIEVDGRLIPVSAEVQILHDSGAVTFEGAQLLSTRVVVDPALFRKRGEEPALAKTRKQATPAGTITVENPTEMTVLDFMDLLHGAGFADERMLTLTAEAVGRARGILKDGKPDGDFLRATKKVLRPIGKGYDAIIGELRNHIQFNIANAPRGVLLDTVSDGYKMGLTGHWRAMARQLNIGGRASRTAYRGIRQNTQDGVDALFPVEAELGISRKLRVPGSRSEVDVSGRTFVEKIEAAIHAPKIASRIFSSSEYRDFRHARDELRRMLVYSEVIERAHPAALERFVGVLRRQAAKAGTEPQTWIDGIREAATTAGKTTGVFDTDDVLRGTGRTDLSRAWKAELNTLRKAGHEAEQKLFFSYKQTNADAILRRTMFFHYWMSRELALHARLTLKNPALMASYYRFWEGWQRVAEEEAYPTSVRAFMGFMVDTTGGWASVFDPASMLVPWTMFSEMTNEDMPTFDRLGVFFNPIVQGAAAAWGATERTPDLTGTYGVRSLIRAVADYGQGLGIDVLGKFGGGDGALDQWQRRVFEKANDLATGFDFPGASEYEPFRPETNQIDMLRSVVMAKAQEQGLSIDSPQVQDAFAAIDAGDYESNPLAEAAFKEYTSHRLFGRLVGLFLPNRTRYGPRDEAIVGNQAFGQAIGAGQTPTLEAEAAHLERESATSAEPELVSQADQYFNLGTERQRSLHTGWNDIANGDLAEWKEAELHVGGRVIRGYDLVRMSDEQRATLADLWVSQYEGAQELDAYRTMRDDFIARNPAFAEYDEYRDLAFGYEGGVRVFRADMAQHHPEFADELEDRRAFFRGDGRRGEVLEKELDQWATSQAGYHAFRGERDSIYDEQPEPAYDVSADPYLSVRGAGESGGGARSRKGTAQQLAEDLAEYEMKSAQMTRVLGTDIIQFNNPVVRQALEAQYGDLLPQKTRLMLLYEQWASFQEPGADTSIQAFSAYMDQLEYEAMLGLMPAA